MSTKKQIGRIPISKGEYVAGQTYNRLNQVTMYGSTYQSMIDGNTSAPAILDENGNVQHANTDQWLVIADGREAYNAGEKLSSFSLQESEEYLALEKDASGHILSSTNADGSHYIYNVKSETIIKEIHFKDDEEGRLEKTIDVDGNIVSYRDKNGNLHEHRMYVNKLQLDSKELSWEELNKLIDNKCNTIRTKEYYLPKFGTVDIKSETFFLTFNDAYTDKNGVFPIVVNEDTDENAIKGLSVFQFFVKSSLTNNGDGTYSKNSNSVALDFYVPSKVTKIGNNYYVTSTLSKNELDGTFSVQDSSIKVTKIEDTPTVGAWTIDKKTEHWCVVDIDFGQYLKGTFFVGIKFQGSSTLSYRKKNFRFTFYKNNSYDIKDKIKIGEFVRTSGYNLKANWTDITRMKEFVMNRILMAVWENRGNYEHYPWDKENIYSGATGMIKGFPVRVNVGGSFYGLEIFGLKKDGKNYLLNDDSEGMIVSGTRGNFQDPNNWTAAKPEDWEDELNDELSESNKDALTSFFSFINDSSQFNKENIPTHMSVLDWIDYYICLQVFLMRDNTCRNMILYSGKSKVKFYPFFYDLDLSWQFNSSSYDLDINNASYAADMSLWNNFTKVYHDEIVNRYAELRQSVLTKEYMSYVYDSIVKEIPLSTANSEKSKWGYDAELFAGLLNAMQLRLNWLDENVFIK